MRKEIFKGIQSVQFSCSVMSNSLQPHGLQHARLPCSSLTPGVCPSSCPLYRRCHPANCHPPFLLPSTFPSIRVFSNESALCIRWPKYWSFSFSINSSNEYSGLISFRIQGVQYIHNCILLFISFLLFAVIPFVCHFLSKSHGFFIPL